MKIPDRLISTDNLEAFTLSRSVAQVGLMYVPECEEITLA